ncbi:MAG: protein TolQ [Alphaproteobacteria bacterium]
MENSVIDAVTLGGSVADIDFSVWSLFMRADWIIKAVIVMLLLASIWCWAIIFEKIMGLRKLNAGASKFEQSFWSGVSLDDLYARTGSGPGDPMTAVFVAAMKEWKRAPSVGDGDSTARVNLGERIDRVMQITLAREMDRTERYMTFLATTGSTAPFVGLFGTVWGIMNSFQSIAISKNTSLAVVAPGIAEALFATALGLLAAIPAVVAYNKLSRDLDRYAGRLESFAGEFSAILSRQLDERSQKPKAGK